MDPVLLGEILAGTMFLGVIGMLMLGFPMTFTLAGTSIIFAYIGLHFGVFDMSNLRALAGRYTGYMINEVLVAVPLFIFMGVMLERSNIAEQLLSAMGKLFGNMRGGLGISVVLVGALLAASTGVVGATVVTMGLISLPAMLRAGYDPKLASGVICAFGTLGQIIPPSTVLIFMGDMLAGINAQVQMAKGNFAPSPVSVGDLFAGAIFPGLLLVTLYLLWVAFKAITAPESCPATPVPAEEKKDLFKEVLVALIPPLVLIVAVLGSILGGIATATEAAAVGAVGATLLAGMRTGRNTWALWVAVLGLVILMVMAANFDLRLGRPNPPTADQVVLAIAGAIALACAVAIAVIWRDLGRTEILRPAMSSTARTTSMIFTLIIGALLFSLVFRGLGGEERIRDLLDATPGGPHTMMFFVLFMMFLLGLFLDYVEITIIAIPVVGPPILAAGIDPIWFGV